MKKIFACLAMSVAIFVGCRAEIENPDPNNGKELTLDTFEAVHGEVVLLKGETFQVELNSSIDIADLDISWFSSNSKVVAVDLNGMLTAKSEGEAEITASVNKFGNEAVVKATVSGVKIAITPAIDTVAIGGKANFSAVIEPEGKDVPVTWSTSSATIATVTESGEATGKVTGSVTIKAENAQYKASGTASLLVTSVAISTKTTSLVEEETFTFKASVAPQAYKPNLIWASSNPEVASITQEGLVTALKAGKTTISVTSDLKPFATASVELTVNAFSYFAAGEGTEASPFVISTAADLKRWSDFANKTIYDPGKVDVTKANFVLDTDIDMMSTAFVAIPSFTGTFDGKDHAVRNLKISDSGNNPLGFFREATGARISNVKFSEISVSGGGSTQMYVGAVVGKAENVEVKNVTIDGTVAASGKGTIPLGGSIAVAGGVMGQATSCTIDGVTARLYLGSQGQYIGGIAGLCYGTAKISSCTLVKGSELMCQLNNVGGIAGAIFDDTLIENCEIHGAVKSKYALVGGIVGQQFSGTVKNCLVSSAATVSGDVGNGTAADAYSGVGGITGKVNIQNAATSKKVIIENCAVYCDVTANDNVGGIVGQTTSAKDAPTFIVNCLYSGSLSALYKNNYSYGLAGGVCGWAGNAAKGKSYIANCACIVSGITVNAAQATSGCFGGIYGYNQIDNETYGCYSTLTEAQITSASEGTIKNIGGLTGRTGGDSNGNSFTNCYSSSAITAVGYKNADQDLSKTAVYASLKDAEVKAGLEAGSAAFNARNLEVKAGSWTTNAEGYFIPEGLKADVVSGGSAPVKVSLIGDSISTFSGYLPTGYNTFYPTGDVISANQTYWYRLIYNNMKNARLEMNIAWTGTLVTRSTNEAMKTQHWYGHDFNARFIDKGMGNPDVILVHGGTNDIGSRGYSEAKVTLYKNLPTNGSQYPTDAEFAEVFAAVDAVATSRAALVALPDTTFVEAYTKLIALIHQQYPQARVVMLIGDYIPEGARQSILKIAAHYNALYGYKVVDFVASNGFQSSKYITKATGCHPDSNGFKWMADQIYKEQGSYIEGN